MQRQLDAKGNIVDVTLFESYLSRFVLEHPEFYQHIFIKLLDAIEQFIATNRTDDYSQNFLADMFFDLNRKFKFAGSFAELRANFNLLAVKDCIKKCSDELLRFEETDILPKPSSATTLSALAYQSLFANPRSGYATLGNYLRSEYLFHEANRGVKTIYQDDSDTESDEIKSSRNLGIVDESFVPNELKDYFEFSNESAGFDYIPDFDGYVANWLYDRNLPIISGTSGSMEQLFSILVPLVSLTKEEIRLVILAETAAMIAMGHHSFFECMLVADRYGYRLYEHEDLLQFYLQCIPATIARQHDFRVFLNSDKGAPLIAELPTRVSVLPWLIDELNRISRF